MYAEYEVTASLCEYSKSPLGIDAEHPRLSWQLKSHERGKFQTAYQILAASTEELLTEANADLWNTGKVDSDQTTLVPYAGTPLKSSQKVFWKVRSWDENGKPSAWSSVQSWINGILKIEDWKAKWIVAPWSSEALLVRNEFESTKKLKSALVHICGLGQFELFLNGQKVSDHLLAPGWTKYNRTCLYETHNITSLVNQGKNAIGVALGDGMYHTERRNRFSKFQGTFGPQRLICQIELEYEDGSRELVASDESWKVSQGPVTFSDIFGGEDYDARHLEDGWNSPGFDDSRWESAVLLVRPGGRLRGHSSSAQPLKAIESFTPISIQTISPTRDVIDFGQNASCMPKITVSGPIGSTIRLTHAEVVHEDGNINRRTCGGGSRGPAYWQYTKRTNKPETWFPQFFYAGYRYLQLDKIPAGNDGALPELDHCEAVVVHSSAEATGHFETSNELINRIRTLVRWAQRSNMVSVLTDCPHREKLGWLEQYYLNGPAIRYEFDVNRIFVKGMRDMADSQLGNGLVPNIAPEYVVFPGTFRAASEWGAAVILVPWQQYLFTGDTSLFEQYYKTMQRYVAYLESKSVNHILDEGLGDWYDLGPADRPGHAQLTPPQVTATAFYFESTKTLAKIAKILGKQEDAEQYAKQAEEIRAAWLDEFHNDDGTYATNSQCSNAIALELGLALEEDREKVLETLVDKIIANGNATTAGDVGHRYMLQALANGGHSDLIYKMINQDEKPGYGYQLKQGATSLTEAWDANHKASHNHFMLGHITEWFYKQLVGIQPDPENPGFKNIIIAPTPVEGLNWAEATYDSIHGPISVRWERNETGLTVDVSIPANTTATVHLPATSDAKIQEGGKNIADSNGIELIDRTGTHAVLQIESGSYEFRISL